MRILPLLALSLLACSDNPPADPNTNTNPFQLIEGFNPPAIAPGETAYVSPVAKDIKSGQDVTLCSYLDKHFDQMTDVIHFRAYQSTGGHHIIVYAALKPRPVDTHVCNDDDMLNTRFVAAGGSENGAAHLFDLPIPDGLTFRFPAGAQLMIQTHWINATQKDLPEAQAIAYLTQQPAQPGRQVLDLFNVISDSFVVPAGKSASATTTCPIKRDINLYTLDGHQHEFGSSVDIELLDGAKSTMLWSYPWVPAYQFDPPIKVFSTAQPLVLKAGQSLRVTCSWNNTTAQDLMFPREMCVGSGFYFPASGSVDCEEGDWSESTPVQ